MRWYSCRARCGPAFTRLSQSRGPQPGFSLGASQLRARSRYVSERAQHAGPGGNMCAAPNCAALVPMLQLARHVHAQAHSTAGPLARAKGASHEYRPVPVGALCPSDRATGRASAQTARRDRRGHRAAGDRLLPPWHRRAGRGARRRCGAAGGGTFLLIRGNGAPHRVLPRARTAAGAAPSETAATTRILFAGGRAANPSTAGALGTTARAFSQAPFW